MTRTLKTDLALVQEFIRDLFVAIKGVPAEAVEWWRAGHTRTEWLRAWDDSDGGRTGRAIIFTADERAIASHADYKLWRGLGFASDLLLLLIVGLVVAMVVL